MTPSVRGSVILSQLEHVDARSNAAKMLAAVTPAVLAELRQLGRLEWATIDQWMELSRPCHAALGDDGYRELWGDVQTSMVEQPVFRSLVATAVRLFGLTPSSFCRLVPTAQALVFKDVGLFTYTAINKHENRLRWTEIPASVRAHRAMVIGFSGAFSSFFRLCKVEGSVLVSEDADGVSFDLRWS